MGMKRKREGGGEGEGCVRGGGSTRGERNEDRWREGEERGG